MERQEVFNLILSRLDCSDIDYRVVSECGKTVIDINCVDGKMKLTIDTEEK